MKIRSLLTLTAGISLIFNTYSQAQSRGNWCATDQYNAELRDKNPVLYQQRDLLEKEILKKTALARNTQNQKTNNIVKVIPVVVHVVTETGVGGISDAQVLDGIRVLNEDFRRMNADASSTRSVFQGVAADVEFEFRLAQKDPQGNCTNGITRDASIYANGSNYSNRDIVKTAVPSWPTDKYFNVWLVKSIYSPVSGSVILGFAQFPTPVLGVNYGVVIRDDEWGSIGSARTNGRTATHEVGHCLNLYHTFQSGCGNSCDNSGDLVCDTPPTGGTGGTPTYGCVVSLNRCSNDMVGPSPYTTNVVDQIENYMSYDDCQNMFTAGQKTRIEQTIATYTQLQNLVSQANLTATGTNDGYVKVDCPPVSEFTQSSTSVCEGGSISFTPYSYNVSSSSSLQYNWNFQGAASPTQTGSSPQVTYPTPGFYNVSLTTTYSGGSDTETKPNLIRVVSVTNGETVPYTEGFENSVFPVNPTDPLKNWITEVSLQNTNKWERTTNAAKTGNASIRLRNNTNIEGSVSSIISPSFNFTNLISGAGLSFDLAFAQRSSTDTDVLKVYISTDCGQNWQLRKTISGSGLSTNGNIPVASSFTPNNTQWRNEQIGLAQFQRRNSVMFKIEFTSGGGNIIYLDNFMISGVVGLSTDLTQRNFAVYPNPITENSLIQLTLDKAEIVEMELFDIVGKLVYQENDMQFTSGTNTFNLNQKFGKLNSGVYLLKIFTKNKTYKTKLIVN